MIKLSNIRCNISEYEILKYMLFCIIMKQKNKILNKKLYIEGDIKRLWYDQVLNKIFFQYYTIIIIIFKKEKSKNIQRL